MMEMKGTVLWLAALASPLGMAATAAIGRVANRARRHRPPLNARRFEVFGRPFLAPKEV